MGNILDSRIKLEILIFVGGHCINAVLLDKINAHITKYESDKNLFRSMYNIRTDYHDL